MHLMLLIRQRHLSLLQNQLKDLRLFKLMSAWLALNFRLIKDTQTLAR